MPWNKVGSLPLSISVLLGFFSKNCVAVAGLMISLGSTLPTNQSKKGTVLRFLMFTVSHIAIRVFSTLILHVSIVIK